MLGLSVWFMQLIVQSVWYGVELVVEDVNVMVVRKKFLWCFCLLVQDDQGLVNFGVNVVCYFIKEKVVGVIGFWSSDVVMVMVELYEVVCILQIGFMVGISQWISQGNCMLFWVVGGIVEVGLMMVEVIIIDLKGKWVFVVYNDLVYSNVFIDELIVCLVNWLGLIVICYLVGWCMIDFNVIIKVVNQYQVDVIVFFVLFLQVVVFVEEVWCFGMEVKVLLVGGVSSLFFGEVVMLQVYVLEYELVCEQCLCWKVFIQVYMWCYNVVFSFYFYYVYDVVSVLIVVIL